MKTSLSDRGFSDDAELGMLHASQTVEGRAFMAHILLMLDFCQLVTDPAHLPAQTIGINLFHAIGAVNETAALEIVKEFVLDEDSNQGGES